jgi:glycosyltransferase involved in cell wall biosynthesis
VVVPTFNAAPFLEACLTSIVEQSRSADEVIVVDDGSTDDTIAIVESFCRRHSTIQLFRMPSNGGPSAARNAGISALRTAFVAFLDADDLWASNHLQQLSRAIEQFPTATLCFADTVVVLDQLATSATEAPSTVEQPLLELAGSNYVPQSAAMACVDAIRAVGGYRSDLRYAEDYDLWRRLCTLPEAVVVHVSSATTFRRLHAGQVSVRYLSKMIENAWQVRRLIADSFVGLPQADRLNALLRGALEADLRAAWEVRDRLLISRTLQFAEWLPQRDDVGAMWSRIIGAAWPLIRAAAAIYDHLLPESMRRIVRRLRRQR